jgi:hypothetical protein
MVLPLDGTSLTGKTLLEALVPGGATKVEFRASGGRLRDTVLATANETGKNSWVAYWNARAAHPGSYTIWAVDYLGSRGSSSPPIYITVKN